MFLTFSETFFFPLIIFSFSWNIMLLRKTNDTKILVSNFYIKKEFKECNFYFFDKERVMNRIYKLSYFRSIFLLLDRKASIKTNMCLFLIGSKEHSNRRGKFQSPRIFLRHTVYY